LHAGARIQALIRAAVDSGAAELREGVRVTGTHAQDNCVLTYYLTVLIESYVIFLIIAITHYVTFSDPIPTRSPTSAGHTFFSRWDFFISGCI
jgi:hypothetical protein